MTMLNHSNALACSDFHDVVFMSYFNKKTNDIRVKKLHESGTAKEMSRTSDKTKSVCCLPCCNLFQVILKAFQTGKMSVKAP